MARAANAKLAPVMAGDGELLMILTGDRLPTMPNLVERFEAEWLKDRGYAARYLVEIQFKLERYRQDLGDQLIGQLDVLTVAEYLDGFSNNAYTKHRGLLIQIFAFAVAKGLTERNVAELTLIKKEAEKKASATHAGGPDDDCGRGHHANLVEACHPLGAGEPAAA